MFLRQIVLNGNAGAFVNILATLNTSKFDAMEDEAGSTQGIQTLSLMDNFVTTNTFSFASEPVQVPNYTAWDHFRKLLGMPAQNQVGAFNARAADKLLSARSNGGSGTTLRFTEYE
jgi:hypothetical protein